MKTIRLVQLLIPIIFLFIFQGCIVIVDDEPLVSKPDCDIVSLVKVNGDDSNYSKFRIKIANISMDSKAFNINCDIKMKVGNIIVDRSSEEFGDLYYRESVIGDVIIYNIYDHSDYSYAEVTISWEDEYGNIYEKDYVY